MIDGERDPPAPRGWTPPDAPWSLCIGIPPGQAHPCLYLVADDGQPAVVVLAQFTGQHAAEEAARRLDILITHRFPWREIAGRPAQPRPPIPFRADVTNGSSAANAPDSAARSHDERTRDRP